MGTFVFSSLESEGRFVECSAGHQCRHGRYFHLRCKDLTPEDIPEDDEWWCSVACRQFSKLCVCHLHKPRLAWVGCSSKKRCINEEWFHRKCVGLKKLPGKYIYCLKFLT